MDNTEIFDPIHPGEILKEDYLIPMNISQSKLASDLDIPLSRVNEIVNGARSITMDTAIRLSEYFGTSVGLWMNLQNHYDLEVKKRSGEYDVIASRIRKQAV